MAKAAALPGSAFARRALLLQTLPAGGVWRRVFETRFPDPLGWGPALSRFSDPTGNAYGVVYFGSTAKVAFVEVLLRDQADGRGGDCVLELAEIEKRSLASIEINEPLRLVDLTGDGGLKMGVPSDVVGSRDQSLARKWSVGFHSHPDEPDGILYPSRLNEERCIALFDRALAKVEAIAAPLLIECGRELALILDELEIALV